MPWNDNIKQHIKSRKQDKLCRSFSVYTMGIFTQRRSRKGEMLEMENNFSLLFPAYQDLVFLTPYHISSLLFMNSDPIMMMVGMMSDAMTEGDDRCDWMWLENEKRIRLKCRPNIYIYFEEKRDEKDLTKFMLILYERSCKQRHDNTVHIMCPWFELHWMVMPGCLICFVRKAPPVERWWGKGRHRIHNSIPSRCVMVMIMVRLFRSGHHNLRYPELSSTPLSTLIMNFRVLTCHILGVLQSIFHLAKISESRLLSFSLLPAPMSLFDMYK